VHRVYAAVFIDAVSVKVCDGQAGNQAFYSAIGLSGPGTGTYCGPAVVVGVGEVLDEPVDLPEQPGVLEVFFIVRDGPVGAAGQREHAVPGRYRPGVPHPLDPDVGGLVPVRVQGTIGRRSPRSCARYTEANAAAAWSAFEELERGRSGAMVGQRPSWPSQGSKHRDTEAGISTVAGWKMAAPSSPRVELSARRALVIYVGRRRDRFGSASSFPLSIWWADKRRVRPARSDVTRPMTHRAVSDTRVLRPRWVHGRTVHHTAVNVA
jgi:hypothetical protein